MNTKKTLADAQPGGRVRLGDQAERARFEAWPHAREFEIQKDGSGEYLSEVTHGAWLTWKHLSAQPSPGGQDALANARELLAAEYDKAGEKVFADRARKGRYDNDPDVRAIVAALAARQPSKQPDSVALGEATEFCIEKGVRQSVGEPVAFQLAGSEPLWCLHVLGMDDVHPAPSKAHAEKAAAWHNEQFKGQAARLGISIEAKVVPWPHSAESHAAGVAEFIPQWLIPQWQLDALEANAKQPAQAVDLGTGIKAIASERVRQLCIEGFSRDSDEQYREGELARAATAYVQLAAMDLQVGSRKHIASQEPPFFWPWAQEWWKPVDARRDLVRAGALIAAQIDLIDSQAVGNG
ncbi:hypothetical protein ACVHXL_06330 [Stenotrophomonas sp. FS3]